MAEVTDILNDPFVSGNIRSTRLSELDDQLIRWHAALPGVLVLTINDFSNVNAIAFGLHMQYHRLRMLVHRAPTIRAGRKRKFDSENLQSPTLNNWTREESNKLIYENVIRISQLGFAYKQIYGTENTPSIMLDNLYVAARTLISHVLRQSEGSSGSETDVHSLGVLDETMEALQVHFPITRRMRKTLARLVSSTRISHLFEDHNAAIPSMSVSMADNPGNSGDGGDYLSAGPWGSFENAFDDFIYDASIGPYHMDPGLWDPLENQGGAFIPG